MDDDGNQGGEENVISSGAFVKKEEKAARIGYLYRFLKIILLYGTQTNDSSEHDNNKPGCWLAGGTTSWQDEREQKLFLSV